MKNTRSFPKFTGSFWAGLGVSLVAIGLGIGSGEFILWPYLSVKHGYGILWAALLGIAFQVFLNSEIQRYAVVTGKSAVHGFLRISRYFSVWLLFSTVIGFGWPGFASGSATLLTAAFSVTGGAQDALPYALLVIAVLVLVLGTNSYGRVEKFLKYAFPLSFLFMAFLFIYYFDPHAFMELLRGVVGQGNGYKFIPKGLDLAVFLGAFAYAGSGGNLLLGQGYYVLKKEHGMAKYKDEKITAAEDKKSLHHFAGTRKFIVLENILIFGVMGFLTILMLSYLGPVLLKDLPSSHGFGFLLLESQVISSDIGKWAATLFLGSGALALFSVQLGVFDLLGRIAGEILGKPEELWYRVVIVVQGILGLCIFLFGFKEPLWLITVGAVCNALAMAVIAVTVLWMNNTHLAKSYRPSKLEQILLGFTGVVYALFFLYTVVSSLLK